MNSALEQELIDKCRKADRKAQEGLYRYFYGYTMGICLRYSKNKEEAQEVLNDSFLKIFSKISQYDAQNPFRAWLRRIVVNTALDAYRKRKQAFVPIENIPETEDLTPDTIANLQAEQLLECVQKLEEPYKMIFNLYEMEGFSHKEIGEILSMPESTSRTYLTRAKAKLKQLITNNFAKEYAR